jgi:small Trp-rich protein
MYAVGLGLVLLALKYLEIGPVANWSWWWCLAPFAVAVVWWQWSDSTGFTKKKAMEREDARKQARLDKHKLDIGTIRGKKKR